MSSAPMISCATSICSSRAARSRARSSTWWLRLCAMSATVERDKSSAGAPQPGAAWNGAALRRTPLAGFISVVTGLLLWELLSRVVVANPLFLAAPSQIFSAILSLAESGELGRHVGISALEFAIGYVIASFIGIGLGFAMASSETAKQVSQPW